MCEQLILVEIAARRTRTPWKAQHPYPTVRALANAVQQDTAYVARTIRLTQLAPDIIRLARK
jgi:hypothetical protein